MARTRSGVMLAAAPAPPITSTGTPTRTQTAGKPRQLPALGPRGYLYVLVLLEVLAIAGLRHTFRAHHGG